MGIHSVKSGHGIKLLLILLYFHGLQSGLFSQLFGLGGIYRLASPSIIERDAWIGPYF